MYFFALLFTGEVSNIKNFICFNLSLLAVILSETKDLCPVIPRFSGVGVCWPIGQRNAIMLSAAHTSLPSSQEGMTVFIL